MGARCRAGDRDRRVVPGVYTAANVAEKRRLADTQGVVAVEVAVELSVEDRARGRCCLRRRRCCLRHALFTNTSDLSGLLMSPRKPPGVVTCLEIIVKASLLSDIFIKNHLALSKWRR